MNRYYLHFGLADLAIDHQSTRSRIAGDRLVDTNDVLENCLSTQRHLQMIIDQFGRDLIIEEQNIYANEPEIKVASFVVKHVNKFQEQGVVVCVELDDEICQKVIATAKFQPPVIAVLRSYWGRSINGVRLFHTFETVQSILPTT